MPEDSQAWGLDTAAVVLITLALKPCNMLALPSNRAYLIMMANIGENVSIFTYNLIQLAAYP